MDHTIQQQNSPIQHLPVELLSYIFVLSARTGETVPEDDPLYAKFKENKENFVSPCTLYSPVFPSLLAAVSRHWRHVALSTSELWSKVWMTADDVLDEVASESEDSGAVSFRLARMFLPRSGNFPLDILLDARDPDWDFSEFDESFAGRSPHADINFVDERYVHPFSPEHMHTALHILLPHIQRFRTLTILTDRWAPMHIALKYLSVGATHGVTNEPEPPRAPLLESLALMRCNEFASYASEFTPKGFENPTFLPFGGSLDSSAFEHGMEHLTTISPALPRLKNLTLSGVHVQWSLLPLLLPHPSFSPQSFGLHTLELSYHCREVRQSHAELRALLERSLHLQELTLRVSGPRASSNGTRHSRAWAQSRISLPRLTTFTLGYDDRRVTTEVFQMIHMPNVQDFTLENGSHSTSVEEMKGLLRYFATGGMSERYPSHQPGKVELRSIFPLLRKLTLHAVNACESSFATLFGSLPLLKQLTLSHTPLVATAALRPKSNVDGVPLTTCPCPLLETLQVRGPYLDTTIGALLDARTAAGAVKCDARLEPGAYSFTGDLLDGAHFNEPITVAWGEIPNHQALPAGFGGQLINNYLGDLGTNPPGARYRASPRNIPQVEIVLRGNA
ncbi:hypothetical protein AcV7_007498 [Taiwanofungus camphoratus]|nr:hypothetical protein AcV7_007498 [Antrodia cinnamomea]